LAEFSDEEKALIVTRLAHFKRPTDVLEELREMGIESDLKHIGGYDPTRGYFRAGDRWRVLFEEEREAFMTGLRDIPIANQRFRLNALQDTFEQAVKSKNRVLANQTLRQAAEEVGGAMTNERNVKVTKGAEELTPDERRAALAEAIRGALSKIAGDPVGTQPAPPATQ